MMAEAFGSQARKLAGFPHWGKIVALIASTIGLSVFLWAVSTHHLNREAHVLHTEGSQHRDSTILAAAGDRFAALLPLQPRALVPLDWAATQSNLGAVFTALGQRESGTTRLTEAV